MWSIPYSLTPPRDDIDKGTNRDNIYTGYTVYILSLVLTILVFHSLANNKILIIDAVFNSDTYNKGLNVRKRNGLNILHNVL